MRKAAPGKKVSLIGTSVVCMRIHMHVERPIIPSLNNLMKPRQNETRRDKGNGTKCICLVARVPKSKQRFLHVPTARKARQAVL